jgi:4-hydroxy-3-methylbut-2-enyl diphosphate reductase
MKVIKIEPHSYCEGVTRAFALALKSKKEHPDSPVYLLGSLVHNEDAVAELLEKGFHLIDEKKENLREALLSLPEDSYLIFSAHGHPEEYEKIAEDRHLRIIDATCPFVSQNMQKGKALLSSGREIIYLGEKGHLEAEAFLSLDPSRVFLLDPASLSSFDYSLIKDKAPGFICQTTMGSEEVAKATAEVYKHIPALFFLDGRCPSTKKRQQAIVIAPFEADLFVILGSLSSNNTMKLVHLAKESHPNARIIRAIDLNELKKFNLKQNHIAILASGASTSPSAYKACLEYLESL